jgi:hypothetical protein
VVRPLSEAEKALHAEAVRQGIAPPLVECELHCNGLPCTDEQKAELLEGRHHPLCPLGGSVPTPPPVEEVLGDLSEEEGPTEEELARALALVRRSRKKRDGRCPGDGCGKPLQPGEQYCWACAAKKVACVRCAAGLPTAGEFLCPLCVAGGHAHCQLCLRPRQAASGLCERCDADSRAANLGGGGAPVPDHRPASSEEEIAGELAHSHAANRPDPARAREFQASFGHRR